MQWNSSYKRALSLFGTLLLAGFFLVNCTEAPPLPPGSGNGNGGDGKVETPGTNELLPNPGLRQSKKTSLPRQVDTMFVLGNVAYACTREGSLYSHKDPNKEQSHTPFAVSAIDLVASEVKWTKKATSCMIRSAGDSLYIMGYFKVGSRSAEIHKVSRDTGELQATLKVELGACTDAGLFGPGERMFQVKRENQPFSCMDFQVSGDRLAFSTQESVQLFDRNTGERQWEVKTDGDINRIAAIGLSGQQLVVVLAAKALARGYQSPARSTQSAQSAPWIYQARSFDLQGKVQWNAGPLPGGLVQANVSFFEGRVLLQTMSSVGTLAPEAKTALKYYSARSPWTATINLFSLDPKTGAPHWDNAPRFSTAKTSFEVQPKMSRPLFHAGSFYVQVDQKLNFVDVAKGVTRGAYPLMLSGTSQIFSLGSKYLHLRGEQGRLGILTLGAKLHMVDGPYIHDAPMAAAADGSAAPKKTPKHIYSATGYCKRLDGTVTPMANIDSRTRFFLPPGRVYYGPNRFFSQFCANYRVDLAALPFGSTDGQAAWKASFHVPEAPMSFILRGNILQVLSDNGDMYTFKMP